MSTEELRAELRAIDLLRRVSYGRVATSMRAMPFVAPARHVVAGGSVLLRMHAGLGYHRACGAGVVAYGADNFSSDEVDRWSVQFTGTAEIIEPTAPERKCSARARTAWTVNPSIRSIYGLHPSSSPYIRSTIPWSDEANTLRDLTSDKCRAHMNSPHLLRPP